jgi:transposase
LRRRRYDADFKTRVAREAIETGNGTVVARRYELAPALVNRWAKSYQTHGDAAFDPKKRRSRSGEDTTQRVSEVERENDQLKRLLGEKDLEIAILRDLVKKGTHL